jgi:hypothetical protein
LKQAVLTYWDHYSQEIRPGGHSSITYVWHLDLVALLEVLSESLDEFLGGNVLDGNSTAGINCAKFNL